MAQKIRDLAVKTGTYTDGQGQEKGRWMPVGALMKGDDGNEFLLLNRTFNPAGVPQTDGRESVIVSAFPVRDQQGGGQSQPSQPAHPASGDDSSEVPF